jgi:hypothetical protein
MGQGHLSKEELDGGMNSALLSPSSSHYLVVNLAMESPLYLSLSIDDFPRKTNMFDSQRVSTTHPPVIKRGKGKSTIYR